MYRLLNFALHVVGVAQIVECRRIVGIKLNSLFEGDYCVFVLLEDTVGISQVIKCV
jgi:hypothetical protein